MPSKVGEIRLTLYALVTAIEADLRSLIISLVIPHKQGLSFLDDSLRQKVIDRFEKEQNGLAPEANAEHIVPFLDFQDAYKTVLSSKDVIPNNVYNEIRKITPQLDRIVAIRNRVMHNRPLQAGDYSFVYALIIDLLSESNLPWTSCRSTCRSLDEDASYVFQLAIPDQDSDELSVFHNLPMPDFDESGFIGRENDIKDVKRLLLGSNRVVSVIGAGGVGKTALILRVAYDLLELGQSCPFEAILWTSAKTTVLTPSGIEQIRNSLRTYSGLIETLAIQFACSDNCLDNNLKEVLEFLRQFKVLLVIDNLETFLDDKIREFIREAQQHCKIAITSRIGLGELEYRRNLEGLTEKESTELIREIAKVRNSKTLLSLKPRQLADISRRLHFNPLAIKWFVNSVESGRSPQEVLDSQNDLLAYCFSNVYGKIEADGHLVINTLLAARRPLGDAELHYLSDLEPLRMRKALNALFATAVVKRELVESQGRSECLYAVSDFAKMYLMQEHPPDHEFVRRIQDRKNKLVAGYEDAIKTAAINKFDARALSINTQNEKAVARYLSEALSLSKPTVDQCDEALNRLAQARAVAPNYFETHRVSAYIKCRKGDYLGAEEDYKAALEIEPANSRLLYYYAGFLLTHMNSASEALPYAQRAYELDSQAPETVILYARCLAYLGEHQEALRLLDSLRQRCEILRPKTQRILFSQLINIHRRVAELQITVNQNPREAITHLASALYAFEQAKSINQVDTHIIEEYSVAFQMYLQQVSASGDPEEKSAARVEYERNRVYLDCIPTKENIFHALSVRYGISAADSPLNEQGGSDSPSHTPRFQAIVASRPEGAQFGFLESASHPHLFFHQAAARTDYDRALLQEGSRIEYSLGSNNQGYCAVDLEVISTPYGISLVDATASELIQAGTYHGVIKKDFQPTRPYHFIVTKNHGDLFCHKTDLTNPADWNLLSSGREVFYQVKAGAKGSQANYVRQVGNSLERSQS